MEIYLNTGHLFTVPTAVADHFLKLASGDQLKVLLYVLCHADTALTAAQIAQHCGVKPAAVEEALTFWQSVNILSEQSGGATAVRQSVQTAEPQPATSVQAMESPVPAQKPVQLSSTVWAIDPAEMAERIKADKTISDMFSIVELNAGGLLNHTVQKCLLWMHEYLGLSPDIIVMLAAYCNEIGCFQVRYMEKIALEWQERGILTHEAAQKDIQRMESARSFTGQIQRIFEMDRKPTPKQQGFIDGWVKNGFSLELIRLAYEKTRDAIGDKLSFPYIDSILQRWASEGIFTVEAVQHESQQRESTRFFTNQIRRILRLDANLTTKQQSFIDAWEKLGLPLDLIQHAYEKTRDARGNKFSFEYLDSILQRWASAGIRTVEAAEKEYEVFQASKQKKESAGSDKRKEKPSRRTQISSIDPDEIEKIFGAY